jgi:glycosyltransferase involved in cell wall biosynthesis
MKIGIDAHGVGGHSLGAGNETYFGNLIPELLELDQEHEYHCFVNHPAALASVVQKYSNVRVVSLRPHTQWLQRPFSLPLYARRHALDLVHVPFIRPPFSGAKTVITVHDANYEFYPQDFRMLERLRMKTLVPPSCRRADLIFTVSEFTKCELVATYGIPPEKVVVTYNAASHFGDRARLPGGQLVRTFDLPKPFVLFVGTIQPKKNLARLVAAFDRVKRRTSLPHHLVVAGPWGWRNSELNQTLEKLQYRDQIHFPGYVNAAEVRSLMRNAELFVFPSLYESFGIPPLEAQAVGTPVLVSNTTCFPEIYADSAAYCDPYHIDDMADQMQRLLRDSALRAGLVRRGLAQSRRYSWRKTAEIVLAAYNNVLGIGQSQTGAAVAV